MPEPRDYYQVAPPQRIESRGDLVDLIAHALQARVPALMPSTAREAAEHVLRDFKLAGLRIARRRARGRPVAPTPPE
jgi:hypothetical protein